MATFYNQATLSYKGRSITSNIATGELVSTLSLAKTAVTGAYEPGGELVYAVSIINTGANTADGLTLTDDLGAYAFGEETLVPLNYIEGSVKYFIDGALQAAPAVEETSPLTLSGISVPADSNAVILYAVEVNGFASPEQGASIVNTATLTGAGVTTLTASATVTADSESELDIVKSISPAVVAENGEICYTFFITNSGAAEAGAEDNVVLEDTFAPVLHNISVMLDGEKLSEGTGYAYDEASGVFSTVQGAITVPAAEFSQDPETGEWCAEPGCATLTVEGNL